MRKSKPVSYSASAEDLIKWAEEQPGGFSPTVRKALQLLQFWQQMQGQGIPAPPQPAPAPQPVQQKRDVAREVGGFAV